MLAVVAVGFQWASAATLEVSVVDARGAAVPNLAVQVTVNVAQPSPHEESTACGNTNLAGKVSCAGLPTGKARLSLTRPDGYEVIGLGNLQSYGPLELTLTEAGPAPEVDLTLPAGEWLTIEPLGTPDASAFVSLSFLSTTASAFGDARLMPIRRAAVLVPPGTWEFSSRASRASLGAILLDGVPLPRDKALITIVSGSGERHMSLQLEPPSKIMGTVRSSALPDETALQFLDLRAERSRPQTMKVKPNGTYSIELDPGPWRVALTTACEQAALPAPMDVELTSGEQKRLDFELDASKCPIVEKAVLEVTVSSPDEQKLGGGKILLSVIGPDGQRKKRDSTFAMGDKSLSRRFEALPLGEYLVEFSSDGVCPSEATVRLTEPGKTHSVSLAPKRGATVRVSTKLPEGKSVPVRVKLTPPDKQDAPFDPDHPASRWIKLDASGNGEATGFVPGEYVVHAQIDESPQLDYIAKLRVDRDALASDLRVKLVDGKPATLQVVIVPAARLTATLVCLDGGALPFNSAFVWQLRADRPPPPDPTRLAEIPRSEAPFVSVALSGDRADQLVVSQLDPRRSHIAIAFTGMDRLNFPPGTEDPSLAQVIDLRADKPYDLGVIAVDCHPALQFSLKLGTERALLDLRNAEVAAEYSVKEGEWSTIEEVVAKRESIELRDLPEAAASVRITLRHAHLVPDAPLSWTVPSTAFIRGKTLRRAFDLKPEQIGGAIARPTDVIALRLKSGERDWVVGDGTHLPAGRYEVAGCRDTECKQLTSSWSAIEVKVGETTTLPRVEP